MFVRLADGREYKFTFRHGNDSGESVNTEYYYRVLDEAGEAAGALRLRPSWFNVGSVTVCRLRHVQSGAQFVAPAFCNVKDMFCKDTGRKLSLGRALQLGGFTKDERKAFWDTYNARKNRTSKTSKKDAEGVRKEGVLIPHG